MTPANRKSRRRKAAAPATAPTFDLLAVAARSADAPGMPRRPWPADDRDFLAAALAAQHVPAPLVDAILAASPAEGAPLLERLAAGLAATFRFAPLDAALRDPVLPLIGPPGAGKTTLAAKLAARLGASRTLVVTTDAARPGALAQLDEYARVLGLPLVAAADAAALRAVVETAAGRTVIVDTAGADSAEAGHQSALLAAAGAPPLLVLPADCDAADGTAAARDAAALGACHLVVTRLDIVRRIGGVLAAAAAGGLTLLAASITPHFAYGLRTLTPDVLARRVLAGALHEERWRRRAAG